MGSGNTQPEFTFQSLSCLISEMGLLKDQQCPGKITERQD